MFHGERPAPPLHPLGGGRWELHNPNGEWSYTTAHGVRIVPEDGFVTDLASTPLLLRWVFPAAGRADSPYAPAAVIHDYLYNKGELYGLSISRECADWEFLHALSILGINRTVRWAFYWGVRVGGWVRWGELRRADRAGDEAEFGLCDDPHVLVDYFTAHDRTGRPDALRDHAVRGRQGDGTGASSKSREHG